MKITGITWITTYNCNFNCEHCFFETQGEKAYMEPELIDRALDGFKYGEKMFWQHFSGGEIFLEPEKLFAIMKRLRKYFSKNIGISTNGFWGRTPEIAKEYLERMEQLGVNGVAVSADFYHEKYMNKKAVKNVLDGLCETEMKVHSYLMGARLANGVHGFEEANSKAEALAEELKPFKEFPLAPTTVRSLGKGSTINYPKNNKSPQGLCTELCTCLGERSPFNPAMLWVDAYGNVMICYGIVIGNLYKNTLNEIVENYSPNANPILEALSQNGPKGLVALAMKLELQLPESYYDECDSCYQARKALRKAFPEILKPNECYP